MTRPPHPEPSLGDPLVRSAYRGIADERTSASLDNAVLANARAALPPPRRPGAGVSRPLAWAASLGLCLAVVLQVTRGPTDRVPPGEQIPRSPPAGLHESAVELRARKLGDAHREKTGPAAGIFSDEVAPGCNAAIRSARESWLRCIEALETAGHADLAAQEQKLLRDAYPVPASRSE